MSSNAEVTYCECKVHLSDDGSQLSWQAIRVTLWAALGDTLVERKTNKVGLHPVVLTSMNVKLYSNKLYLSSGSSTKILNDPQIPALHTSLSENNEDEVSLSHAAVHADYSQAKEGTVKIDDIKSQKGWNFLGCGGEKYPRFWLELDVSDKIASTVVVMFDDPAKELLKCFADSLAVVDNESGFGYSFTGWRISLEEVVDVDSESSNMNTSTEELEDSNEEVTSDIDDGGEDGKKSSLIDKRKKTRYIVDDCDSA
nr:hypothetical protein [Tanacetum cinerariifolium]